MKPEITKYLQRAIGVDDDGIIGQITRSALFSKLLSIAEGEIGVREVGYSNTGVRVGQYQATTSLGGSGWPWCAAFVCWVIKQLNIFSERDRPKTAGAFAFETWAKDMGIDCIKNPKTIKKGDIVIYDFSHIGIAKTDSNNKNYFLCIEGNTDDGGSRDGGGVYEKNRSIKSVRSIIRF